VGHGWRQRIIVRDESSFSTEIAPGNRKFGRSWLLPISTIAIPPPPPSRCSHPQTQPPPPLPPPLPPLALDIQRYGRLRGRTFIPYNDVVQTLNCTLPPPLKRIIMYRVEKRFSPDRAANANYSHIAGCAIYRVAIISQNAFPISRAQFSHDDIVCHKTVFNAALRAIHKAHRRVEGIYVKNRSRWKRARRAIARAMFHSETSGGRSRVRRTRGQGGLTARGAIHSRSKRYSGNIGFQKYESRARLPTYLGHRAALQLSLALGRAIIRLAGSIWRL